MRRGYLLFLMGTATDLPTRAFVLAPSQRDTNTDSLLAMLRKAKARRKTISSTS